MIPVFVININDELCLCVLFDFSCITFVLLKSTFVVKINPNF